MSKNLWILTKVLLKNGSGTTGKGKKKIFRSQIWLFILVGLCFAPLAGNLIYFISKAYDILAQVGLQEVILSLGLAASAFIIFFFGIFYVMNTFYFTNDIETLLPLPVKPSEILGAKFIVVTVYEYLTELIAFLPVTIVYGVKSGAGILYYIYAAVIFLLLPVISLVMASIIVMVLMRFTTLAKNKDRFRMVIGVIAMFIALGFNIVIQRFLGAGMNEEKLQDILVGDNNALVDLTSRIFPGSKIAALSLINSNRLDGLINLFFFIVISVLVFLLFLYIGELLYFKGVMGISETASKRRKISGEELSRRVVRNSVVISYTWKEIKILFRTPSYFMNCVLMNFLWPVFIIVMLFAQSGGEISFDIIRNFLSNPEISGPVLVIASAVLVFVGASNSVTSTSISREGQQIYVNKYIPVSYMSQIIAKVLSGVFLGCIGMVSMLVVAIPITAISVQMVLMIVVAGLLGVLFSAFTGIIFDLLRPKLHWDNEQKAVKQNFNVLLNMLADAAVAGLTVLAVFRLDLGILETFAGLIVVYGLLNAAAYMFLKNKGTVLFERIES